MLGKKPGACPNFKAAETKHVIPCVMLVLRKAPGMSQDLRKQLVHAGRALTEFVEVVDRSPGNLSPSSAQTLHDVYKRYMAHAASAGIPMKPKNHLWAHLINRGTKMGNPRMYGTWEGA